MTILNLTPERLVEMLMDNPQEAATVRLLLDEALSGKTPQREEVEPDLQVLGSIITAARVHKGMQRADLCEQVTLTYSTLATIEEGVKQPSKPMLRVLCEALDLQPMQVLRAATPKAKWSDLYGIDPDFDKSA